MTSSNVNNPFLAQTLNRNSGTIGRSISQGTSLSQSGNNTTQPNYSVNQNSYNMNSINTNSNTHQPSITNYLRPANTSSIPQGNYTTDQTRININSNINLNPFASSGPSNSTITIGNNFRPQIQPINSNTNNTNRCVIGTSTSTTTNNFNQSWNRTGIYTGSSYGSSSVYNSKNNFGMEILKIPNIKNGLDLDSVKANINKMSIDKDDIGGAEFYRIPSIRDEDEKINLKTHNISNLPRYIVFSNDELRYLNYMKKRNLIFDENSNYASITREDKLQITKNISDPFISAQFDTTDKNIFSEWVNDLNLKREDNTFIGLQPRYVPQNCSNGATGYNLINNNLTNNMSRSNLLSSNSNAFFKPNNSLNNVNNSTNNPNFLNSLNTLSGTGNTLNTNNFKSISITPNFNSSKINSGSTTPHNFQTNVKTSPYGDGFKFNSNLGNNQSINNNTPTTFNSNPFIKNNNQVEDFFDNRKDANQVNQINQNFLNNSANKFNFQGQGGFNSTNKFNTNFPTITNQSSINNFFNSSNQYTNNMNPLVHSSNQNNLSQNFNFGGNTPAGFNSNNFNLGAAMNLPNSLSNFGNTNNNLNFLNNFGSSLGYNNYHSNPSNSIQFSSSNSNYSLYNNPTLSTNNSNFIIKDTNTFLEQSHLEFSKYEDILNLNENYKKYKKIYYGDKKIHNFVKDQLMEFDNTKPKKSYEVDINDYFRGRCHYIPNEIINPEERDKIKDMLNGVKKDYSKDLYNSNFVKDGYKIGNNNLRRCVLEEMPNKSYDNFNKNMTNLNSINTNDCNINKYNRNSNNNKLQILKNNYKVLENNRANPFLTSIRKNENKNIKTSNVEINSSIKVNLDHFEEGEVSSNRYKIIVEFDSPYIYYSSSNSNILRIARLKASLIQHIMSKPEYEEMNILPNDFYFFIEGVIEGRETGLFNLDTLFRNNSDELSPSSGTNNNKKTSQYKEVKIKGIFTTTNNISLRYAHIFNKYTKIQQQPDSYKLNNFINNIDSPLQDSILPKLSKSYTINPTMEELKSMNKSDLENSHLSVENEFARIVFDETINLSNTNLDIIIIKYKYFQLDTSEKKSYNNLNKKAWVTFKNIYNKNKEECEKDFVNFLEDLKNICSKSNTEFIDYNRKAGELISYYHGDDKYDKNDKN